MPKVTGTREGRAFDLLAKLQRGPASLKEPGNEYNARQYKSWSESWILEDLIDLIPELRGPFELSEKLRKVGEDVPPSVIRYWNATNRRDVKRWAEATAERNRGRDVEVPPVPIVIVRRREVNRGNS